MRLAILAPLALLAPFGVGADSAHAQGGSDIYVAPLRIVGDRIEVGTPVNVTRRAGYDNQPFFSPDGSALFYTSYRDGQADIYRYDVAHDAIRQITDTPESEYSPTVMPGGAALSVVLVEADSAQRLWRVPLDGSAPSVLIPDVAPVGYHTWLDEETLALFVLGQPVTLQFFSGSLGGAYHWADNIGRTLATVPGSGNLSYVQHTESGPSWIVSVDTASVRHRLIQTAATEYYAWAPNGVLVTGDDGRLLRHQPGHDDGWVALADLTAAGIAGITRIAVSPTGEQIAIVADGSPDND